MNSIATARGIPVLLLLACLPGGCGLGDMSAAPTAVSQAVDRLLQAAEGGTWPATYESSTTPEFRQTTSKEEYEKIGRAIRDRLGKLTSKDTKGFFVRSMNGTVTAEAAYEAQFDKGKATIRTTLVKTGDAWRVMSFWVTSPEFLEASTLPCPSCGKPRPKDATFCPACGKKIDPAPPPPPGK